MAFLEFFFFFLTLQYSVHINENIIRIILLKRGRQRRTTIILLLYYNITMEINNKLLMVDKKYADLNP